MNAPSTSSRIMLLADRRTPPAAGGVRIQRYRLARVARDARLDAAVPRLVESKRV